MPQRKTTKRSPRKRKEDPLAKYSTRFADAYDAARRMEGERISPNDLLERDEDFVIHTYHTRTSQYGEGEYVAVEIEMADGERYFFNSSSASLRDQLDRVATAFPVRARLTQKTSGMGRSYWTLE